MCRVGLLEKKEGLAASRGLDTEKMDPDPVFLGLLDADSQVFVAGQENAFRHRPFLSQRKHVRDYEGVDAFLLSSQVHEPKTNLDIRLISEGDVLWRRTLRCAVVPVDPK